MAMFDAAGEFGRYWQPLGEQVAGRADYQPRGRVLTMTDNHNSDFAPKLHGRREALKAAAATLGIIGLAGDAEAAKGVDRRQPVAPGPSATWLDVRDFGAVGDSETDDTDAIQAAIDAARIKTSSKWLLGGNSPEQGKAWGGIVFIPAGEYRTTRPLVLHGSLTILGDAGLQPVIRSEADAALICWDGQYSGQPVSNDKVWLFEKRCDNVAIQNIMAVGQQYGLHTMGVAANRMRLYNCRLEGRKAGLAATGFFMGCNIEYCHFHPSLWFIARDGARFNTSVVRHITIGLHGTRQEEWRMRLEGCIQCVSISAITLEVAGKGVLLNANQAGVTVSIDGLWSYDTHGPSEAIRVLSGEGISISNVMALDEPSDVNIAPEVKGIILHNILAGKIDLQGNTTATCVNCPNVVNAGAAA